MRIATYPLRGRMEMTVFRSIALTLFVLISLCLTAPAKAENINYEYLDARLKLLMQRDDMMGLAIAVVENGELTFAKGYGTIHKDGPPVTTDTRFRWASVSKGLAGSLAAQLADEGLISMDDPVSQYTTTLKLPGLGTDKATLEHLLSHRLGLVSNAYDTRLEDGRQPTAIRASLGDLNLICPVGECHGYQNVAFDTISEVFKDVTGSYFGDLAESRVFGPLGMTSAETTLSGFRKDNNFARPYSWSRSRGALRQSTLSQSYFRVASAGGVSSSIRDLAKYMQANMGKHPAVFSENALDLAHAPYVETLRELRGMQRQYDRFKTAEYGLGWRIYDYEGHTVVGHRGGVRGYRALILFDPKRETGVVAMWNAGMGRPVGLQFEVMDMVYGLPKRDWMRLMPEEG